MINSHEVFIHIHQGCFAGTGAIVRLPQCQWSKPDGYGKISQCITTTKHSKAKTVCIFLEIYCNFNIFEESDNSITMLRIVLLNVTYIDDFNHWYCFLNFPEIREEANLPYCNKPHVFYEVHWAQTTCFRDQPVECILSVISLGIIRINLKCLLHISTVHPLDYCHVEKHICYFKAVLEMIFLKDEYHWDMRYIT